MVDGLTHIFTSFIYLHFGLIDCQINSMTIMLSFVFKFHHKESDNNDL